MSDDACLRCARCGLRLRDLPVGHVYVTDDGPMCHECIRQN